MAGIYIHIPFCRKACHYCDFHFSTSLKQMNAMVDAICTETIIRSDFLRGETVHTIYLGGGTPSLLPEPLLSKIFQTVRSTFAVSEKAEITFEVNPDDLSPEKLNILYAMGINRLSIGIQSFSDPTLKWMNRAHSAAQAVDSIRMAKAEGFNNISIDLIYGVPQLTPNEWSRTLQRAINLRVNHISAYCLTVENGTALGRHVAKGIEKPVDEDRAADQFHEMVATLEAAGYEQYEISNFAKNRQYSLHNTNYWTGEKYLGIGPSAHSFDGRIRSWNVASNATYIASIRAGKMPSQHEVLSTINRYNEWVMTGLRTQWGIAPKDALSRFGVNMQDLFGESLSQLESKGLARMQHEAWVLTPAGRLLADGIAASLFITPTA